MPIANPTCKFCGSQDVEWRKDPRDNKFKLYNTDGTKHFSTCPNPPFKITDHRQDNYV